VVDRSDGKPRTGCRSRRGPSFECLSVVPRSPLKLPPRSLVWSLLAGSVLSTLAQGPVWAAGFAVTAQGAAASGKGGAFTAQADDPSALYYNPAGISQLKTARFLVGTTVIIPQTTYSSTQAGRSTSEENQTFFLPQLYVTAPVGQTVTAGLGLYVPFGVATDWPVDWDGRFQVTYISVRAMMVSPTLSWQPTPGLAVAGGLNFASVKLTERRQINLSNVGENPLVGVGPLPGNPEGSVELEGDASGLGYNLGALVVPSDRWQLGLSFRSRVHAEMKNGHADFTIPFAPFAPLFPDGGVRTELDLPPSLRAGVLFRPTPQWNIEGDATWTGWSSLDQMVVTFDQPSPPPDTTSFLWDDVMAYSIGAQYRPSTIALRGGYTLDFSPIPDDTIGPILPDGNRHWFSFGVGYEGPRWSTDLGYHLILFRRLKDNQFGDSFSSAGAPPAIPSIDARANGKYRTVVHSVVLSAVYRF